MRKCFKTEAFDACRGCLLEELHDGDCPGLDKAVDIQIIDSGIDGENNG